MVKLVLNEVPQIRMVCRANKKTSVTTYEDEPLILSVAMVTYAAAHASSHNAPFEDRLQELERKFKEKQMEEEEFKRTVKEIKRRMLKVRIFRFGGPIRWPYFIKFQALSEDTWRDVNWPLKLLLYLPTTQVATLDASTSCYVEYGLDPEDVQRPQGEIQVKAVVEIVKDKTFESDVVTVNFLQQKMPKAERSKEETILFKGRYAYKRGLYEDAMEYVQRALVANPLSLPSLELLGDIEESKGNLRAALSAYEKAREEFYKQYPDMREPPRYFEMKINRLRALMEE